MALPRAVIVAVLVASCAGAARVALQPEAPSAADAPVVVVEVIDGDTVVIAAPDGSRETVRILGVDTPETRHPERGVECMGPEAASHTSARLAGRTVRLRVDTELRDVYGRLLADVEVDGRSYARELLALGLARFFVIAPNDRGARALLQVEADARAAGRGLWGAC